MAAKNYSLNTCSNAGSKTSTPHFPLCREITEKLAECVSLDDKQIAVLFNLEFLHVLIKDYGVSPENITIFVDDDREFHFCRFEYGMVDGVNLFYLNMEATIQEQGLHTRKGKVMKKFDVLVGNPPYQAPKNVKGPKKGTIGGDLWSKFVLKSFELIKENGYVCLVHPPMWRKPEHKLYSLLAEQNKLLYLEVHNKQDGQKTFGAATRYDWYVVQKTSSDGSKTEVQDQDGKIHQINLREWAFLPSAEFELAKSILAKKGRSDLRSFI